MNKIVAVLYAVALVSASVAAQSPSELIDPSGPQSPLNPWNPGSPYYHGYQREYQRKAPQGRNCRDVCVERGQYYRCLRYERRCD